MKFTPVRLQFGWVDRYFNFLRGRGTFDLMLFHLALAAVIGSSIYLILTLNERFITTVPGTGGTLVEGIVGTPRFVNPVLAITRADQDMVELVFGGLLKLSSDGTLVPDAAESIVRSEDGRSYDVTLKRGVTFHNGSELTARDFAFTISLIQNPELKSPLHSNWDKVTVEVIDDHRLTITLEEAYTPFIENLTVGILPRTLWNELPIEQIPFSQNNTEPIGSGPYRVSNVLRTTSGLINAFELTAFTGSTQARPNISTLVFNFYQNEEQLLNALKDRRISGTPSLSVKSIPSVDQDAFTVIEQPLPRTFGIFFNQNRSAALRDQGVRAALSAVIDRQQLVDRVLNGYGVPVTSPVPPGFLNPNAAGTATTPTEEVNRLDTARTLLREAGWQQGEDGTWRKETSEGSTLLSITLTTANTDVFAETAAFVAEAWQELGVTVNIAPFEQTDLVQGIIRPRDFEALVYGMDIGRSLDLYPFWHSSQKNDPGLNIAQYTNIDTDSLLEKMYTITDETEREDTIRSFERIVASELPAIFLYTPTFAYVIDKEVHVSPFIKISKPSERFANIDSWYTKSNRIWPVFSNTKNVE